VTVAATKAFATFPLMRISRLCVMPVTDDESKRKQRIFDKHLAISEPASNLFSRVRRRADPYLLLTLLVGVLPVCRRQLILSSARFV